MTAFSSYQMKQMKKHNLIKKRELKKKTEAAKKDSTVQQKL